MSNYVWYVLDRCVDGKHYAHAFRIRGTINLASFVRDFPDLLSMNPCDTKKRAMEIAQAWNEQYKANGTYMFGDVVF